MEKSILEEYLEKTYEIIANCGDSLSQEDKDFALMTIKESISELDMYRINAADLKRKMDCALYAIKQMKEGISKNECR